MLSAAASNVFSVAASVAAFAMLLNSLTNFVPVEFKRFIILMIRGLINRYMWGQKLTLIIPEFDGLVKNEVYEAATVYLGGKINPTTRSLRLCKPKREKSFKITMENDEEVYDVFDGTLFRWRMVSERLEGDIKQEGQKTLIQPPEVRHFQLKFDAKEKEKVFGSYVPFVLQKAQLIAAEKKFVKLFTIDYGGLCSSLSDVWKPVYLGHPSTFDTLALDPKLKKTILDDLDGFVKRKDFYKRVGKAWKRGYLLYGPPGTGKSSLIAAIANYLNFDVYDLDLSELYQNSDLKKVLVATANRSIIVLEDIDCNIDLSDRELPKEKDTQQLTLSGVLNFIDGLWSTCGDERIIIFTTNHKEKLDPALLRPGRMDMHIHLSYCTPAGFMVLVCNYLGMKHHRLFKDIKRTMKKVKVTPAEVAEKLMKNDKSDVVIQELLDFLKLKKNEQYGAKDAKPLEEAAVLEGKGNQDREELSKEVADDSDITEDKTQPDEAKAIKPIRETKEQMHGKEEMSNEEDGHTSSTDDDDDDDDDDVKGTEAVDRKPEQTLNQEGQDEEEDKIVSYECHEAPEEVQEHQRSLQQQTSNNCTKCASSVRNGLEVSVFLLLVFFCILVGWLLDNRVA